MDIDKLKKLVSDMCIVVGLNTAHDYDGIETEDDVFLYLNAIKTLRNQLYL